MSPALRALALTVALSSVSAFAADDANTISLAPGTSREFHIEGVTQMSMDNPLIANVAYRFNATTFTVHAKSPGETKLYIWVGSTKNEYRLVVKAPNSIKLAVGEKKTVAIEEPSRLATSNTDVADVAVNKNNIVLTGKKEGDVTVVLWSRENRVDYFVTVTAKK